jgi:hypothetical protein
VGSKFAADYWGCCRHLAAASNRAVSQSLKEVTSPSKGAELPGMEPLVYTLSGTQYEVSVTHTILSSTHINDLAIHSDLPNITNVTTKVDLIFRRHAMLTHMHDK